MKNSSQRQLNRIHRYRAFAVAKKQRQSLAEAMIERIPFSDISRMCRGMFGIDFHIRCRGPGADVLSKPVR